MAQAPCGLRILFRVALHALCRRFLPLGVFRLVGIGAQETAAHAASQRPAVQIQHILAQAGLRERAGTIVRHRVDRGCCRAEFRYDVQRVTGRQDAQRQIPEIGLQALTRARAVAAQAILVLVDRRVDHRDAVHRADPDDVVLRKAQGGRRRQGGNAAGGMRVVAGDAEGLVVAGHNRPSHLPREPRIEAGRGYRDLNYLLLKAQRLAVTKTQFLVLQKAA